MRNNGYAEFDGYDMRKKEEMSEVELRKADKEADKARKWIEKNMGIAFPAPDEALKRGNCEGRKGKKAGMA